MVEWVWSKGGKILIGEIWRTGKKNFWMWAVGGWMSREQGWYVSDKWKLKSCEKNIVEYVRNMVEWVWSNGWMIMTDETEVLWKKNYSALVVVGWMSMEHWWKDTDRGKLKYMEKDVNECRWYIDRWVQSNSGMFLTGENWSIGRKKPKNMGAKWLMSVEKG